MSNPTDTGYRIAYTTCPGQKSAEELAQRLVEARLAACVNVVPTIRSFYRWEERVEQSEEWLLLIKTRRDRLAAIEAYLLEHHPYEVPALIATVADSGSVPYLDWISQSLTST
ncbi:divalent-cation tolerance protein CutA [Ectothiorhodospiraceae bacterium BW-2]|nr:divalent-cation tolerance protein CutA [Ectothiorhodospiraceae bacterium BW-2]